MTGAPPDAPLRDRRYRHLSVVEGVAATLREWIVEGRLARGEQLKEVQLTQTLGVGRYSLRSAFQLLAQEGLVRHERNRGAFVREVTDEDIKDLFIMREAIEGQTAALVAERRLDLSPLRRVLDTLRKLPPGSPSQELHRLDFRFHRLLNDMVQSERLRQAFDTIQSQLHLQLAIAKVDDIEFVVGRHELLVDALASGDPERARRAMREHIDVARAEALDTIARENRAPEGPPA